MKYKSKRMAMTGKLDSKRTLSEPGMVQARRLRVIEVHP
jgi:hypothetical protein